MKRDRWLEVLAMLLGLPGLALLAAGYLWIALVMIPILGFDDCELKNRKESLNETEI